MVPDVVSAVVRISRIFGMNCLRLPKASMAAIKEAHSTSAMVAPERRVSGDWEGEVAPERRASCGWEGEAAPGLVELAPRASGDWEGEAAPGLVELAPGASGNWEGEVALGRRASGNWEWMAAPGLVELAPGASCDWEGEVAPERRASGDWEGAVEPVRGVSLSVYQRKNWLGSAFTKEATSYFWASSCRRDFNTDVISKFSLSDELPADGRCGLRGGL